MEGNGILHTIYVCLLYFVFGCEFVFLFFFLAPTIDTYKHNMGLMVLQTRLPLTGIFKQTGFLWHRFYWCRMSLLETNRSALQLQCDVTRSDKDIIEAWGLLAKLTHKCKCSTWFYGDWNHCSTSSHPMLCASPQTCMVPPHLYQFQFGLEKKKKK